MTAKLGDKYTRFLPPAQYNALLNSAQGQLIGLGLELEQALDGAGNPYTVVARVEEDSPAKEAGFMQGDVVIDVDGQNTEHSSPEETAALMR